MSIFFILFVCIVYLFKILCYFKIIPDPTSVTPEKMQTKLYSVVPAIRLYYSDAPDLPPPQHDYTFISGVLNAPTLTSMWTSGLFMLSSTIYQMLLTFSLVFLLKLYILVYLFIFLTTNISIAIIIHCIGCLG